MATQYTGECYHGFIKTAWLKNLRGQSEAAFKWLQKTKNLISSKANLSGITVYRASRTCLIGYSGFISCESSGGGHMHTRTHTHMV